MRKIILSKQASNKLEKLLDYLQTEWSEKTKQDFIKKFDYSVKFIASFPEANEKSDFKKGLYRCIITEQTTIYYQFNSSEIQIVTIFDTRMNPKRLKQEIN